MSSTNYTRLCRTLELAEAVGLETVEAICKAVLEARREHAVFGCNADDAVKQVKSEMLEWEAQAMLVMHPVHPFTVDATRKTKSDDEAYDVIATLIRWILGEFNAPAGR